MHRTLAPARELRTGKGEGHAPRVLGAELTRTRRSRAGEGGAIGVLPCVTGAGRGGRPVRQKVPLLPVRRVPPGPPSLVQKSKDRFSRTRTETQLSLVTPSS